MKVFTVHDTEQGKTWLMGYYDVLDFLMRNNKHHEEVSASTFVFEVENYGPRTFEGIFLVTQHTTDNLR
jgi:hypothetical protein